MKAVIQRVLNASVSIDNTIIGSIDRGYLVLLGVGAEDTKEKADYIVKKLLNLRLFADENDKTNLSVRDVNGSLLIVSQFTLYADCRKGNRPSFTSAGAPDLAEQLYEYIKGRCAEQITAVRYGEFGADMKVELLNDGPFTVILDSADLGC